MKKTLFSLLVAILLCFVTKSNAQIKRYSIKNGFALGGGITQFDIITDNFETVKGDGWMASMSAGVDIPQKWFNVSYGMQLSENTIGVLAYEPSQTSVEEKPIEYKVFTAQVAFLWHAKLAGSYLTLDFGPMLQYNSDLEFKSENENTFLVSGLTGVTTEDLIEISNFNANATVGITAGFSHFKFRAQYIYGLLNSLGKLNKQDFNDTAEVQFKGNQSMLAFTAMITF